MRPSDRDDTSAEPEAEVDEKLQPAKNGLNSLVQAKANQKRQRKTYAKAKADFLKRELDALRRGGSNPKGAARRAVQIAHQLSGVAKEYASGRSEAKAEAKAKTDIAAVADAMTRSADAVLRQHDGFGADPRFAAKIRQLFSQARDVVESQQRRAQAEGHDDREYDSLSAQTRTLGGPDVVIVAPVNLEV